ncbi:type IV pilus secretin PilQ [Vibrio sinensis]
MNNGLIQSQMMFCYFNKARLLFLVGTLLLSSFANATPSANRLNHLDFRISDENNANVLVELIHSKIAVDLQKVSEGLSIELLDTEVSDEQLYVLDVTDFATHVDAIEVFRRNGKVQLLVSINGDFDYDYSLNGPLLHVVIKPVNNVDVANKKSLFDQKGKKISINFQDIPVRNVLQLIAEYNGFNLVVSDSVSGSVTLRLDEIPWQQVLDIILQVKGLDKRVEGSVVLIAPASELDSQAKQRFEKQRLVDEFGDLTSEIIKINYAKASEVASLIGDGTQSMLSERGSIAVDERTNALLVRDLKDNINVVRRIITSLDVPIKQVQIEARIVTISEGHLDELGVRWGFSSSNDSTTVGGSLEGNKAVILDDTANLDDFLNVNLAATAANASSIAFSVAKLGSDTLLDLELSALQTESKAEVIASPRLITTNKKPAYIEQGTEIPYVESSSSGATTIAFKKAVLSLKVTPQITSDNRLILDLDVTQDRPGTVVKTGTGEAVSIETQRIGTQVLVENGETIVLGGIFQHSVADTVDKVPLLGDLPLIGALFKRSYQKMGKSELLIFVTPKVVVQ